MSAWEFQVAVDKSSQWSFGIWLKNKNKNNIQHQHHNINNNNKKATPRWSQINQLIFNTNNTNQMELHLIHEIVWFQLLLDFSSSLFIYIELNLDNKKTKPFILVVIIKIRYSLMLFKSQPKERINIKIVYEWDQCNVIY
jgi:hypothetical protein